MHDVKIVKGSDPHYITPVVSAAFLERELIVP
jgi:hypothetical protein